MFLYSKYRANSHFRRNSAWLKGLRDFPGISSKEKVYLFVYTSCSVA